MAADRTVALQDHDNSQSDEAIAMQLQMDEDMEVSARGHAHLVQTPQKSQVAVYCRLGSGNEVCSSNHTHVQRSGARLR